MNRIDITKLALLIIQDRKVLMNRTRGKDKFYFPGGRPIEGESHEETLVREIQEELSCTVNPDTMEFVCTMDAPAHGRPEGTYVVSHYYFAHMEGEPVPSSEVEEISWLGTGDYDRLTDLGIKVFDKLKADGLID